MVIGMKLNEMHSVRMMTMTDFSVTAAANLLHATQPGISRHLIDMEEFLRKISIPPTYACRM